MNISYCKNWISAIFPKTTKKLLHHSYPCWKGQNRSWTGQNWSLTSPHRCRITSFSQLKQISQSGQDVFYFMFSITFKAFVMFVTFLLFQSNLYVVSARGKEPKISVHRDLFRTKIPKRKNIQTHSCFYAPYQAWIGLQPNWFSWMPQKHHLPKISS